MKRNRGITLIEVIIGVTVGSIIVAIMMQIVGQFQTSEYSSSRYNELNQAMNNVYTEISQEIHNATVVKVNPHKLEIEKGVDKSSYQVEDGILYRFVPPDKIALTPDTITVEKFDVENYSPDDNLVLAGISLKLVHNNKEPKEIFAEYQTVISQRKK